MTARDQARKWLAERLDNVRFPDGTHMVPLSRWGDIISAILDGVELDERFITAHTTAVVNLGVYHPPTHTQVVIQLPAIPLDGPGNGPQSPVGGLAGTGEGDGTHETAETIVEGRDA